jgi:hypothetical protein
MASVCVVLISAAFIVKHKSQAAQAAALLPGRSLYLNFFRGLLYAMRSKIPAAPMPPPMHMVTIP